jgi:signal transduction histidine kinase
MAHPNVRDRVEPARLAEEQAALRRVATLVARGASPAEVCETVAAEVARLLESDFSLVGRYETDATLTHIASHPLELLSQLGPRTVLDGDDLASVVQRSGKPNSINYDDAPGPVAALARELGVRCAVGAPVLVDDQIWGVMAAGWAVPEKASSEAAERTAEFTALLATALANTESRNEITRLAEGQAALRRVATLVAEGAPPADVFESVVTEVGQQFPGANGAALSRYETDGTLTMIGRWSRADGYVPVGARYPLVQGTVGLLIDETRQPGRVDVDAETLRSLPAVIRELGWVSVVAAPIFVEGRLWGLVGISSTTEQSLPSNTEQRLTEFTELVEAAIANAESREALAGLADEQAALLRVATLVAGGVEPGPLFDAIAGEIERLFGVDISALVRFEGDGTVTVMGANGGHHSPGARVQPDPDYVIAAVYRTRQAARFDLEDHEGKPPAVVREWGVRSGVATPIVVEGKLWGAIMIASLDSTLVAATDRRLGDFSALFATAIANMHAREQVADLAEQQAALRRVATLAAREAAPADVLAAVADETARTLGTEAVGMLRFEQDGSATLVAQSQTPWDPPPLGTRLTLEGENIVASVHQTGRASRMDDWANATGSVAAMAHVLGITSAVATPVVVEGRLWGTMVAATSQSEPLPPDTESRIGEFTELVATAIANAETRGELAASRARIVATADATRRRIERDLHDGAQQQLVSLALELRAAQAALPPELNEQRAELSSVVKGLTVVLDELREISSGIHPAILSEGGLAPALKTLARRSPIPVMLDVRVEGRLPESVEVAAYYVVSEMLTNAAKHAHASSVQVDVTGADGVLGVVVRDDGVGGADPARGSGLVGLRDRVETLGGTITVDSPRGRGTSIDVALPLD